MSNESILSFNGGAFLVHDKNKGGESNELGWAYVTIHAMQIIEIGHLENTVARLDKNEIRLKRIILDRQINSEQLEIISIMCNRGFNATYAYNFAQKSTYLMYAESFFRNLLKN